MESSYDELELNDALDEYDEELELEDDAEEEDAEARRRRRKRVPRGAPRAIRPYALGARGVGTAQITNGAGKTAQLRLPAPAVTVPEFRKALGQVQRDVQGSARLIRELREEVDRAQRATRAAQSSAAWAGNAGVLMQLVEQVKDVLVDAVGASVKPVPADTATDSQPPKDTPEGSRPGGGGVARTDSLVELENARVAAAARHRFATAIASAAAGAENAARAVEAKARAASNAVPAGNAGKPEADAALAAATEALTAATAARTKADEEEKNAKEAEANAAKAAKAAARNKADSERLEAAASKALQKYTASHAPARNGT